MKPLRLVLTDHWFEEIKSGRKTSEYRLDTPYWEKRLRPYMSGSDYHPSVVFQKAYRKNPELMEFKIDWIARFPNGYGTDLKTNNSVFEIKLGRRVK